ncbi:dipeptide ABC transporter ATP-binding protein [Pseudooceanicola sp. CBS1P-1]|uniref:Dipeptide ABC transporter ATP-binding protein n=1 Tax=Pseudooceanicola albus TaxID=2692189 RepID=A0A6L7G765_9RHOB|nr:MULTISPECIES: dipeptide ABC transporter ATP-binding protein [Pseudooceanicola]MBT9385195.1 dipeptide ABC transporter ATP-binding protein [Pseudooceanicola endophyticus]MXN18513.1 dipeptide ABC transporter ATP-binding protein [Pseudooceanicola albus]
MTALLELSNVSKSFDLRAGLFQRVIGHVHAVSGVSARVERGRTLGLVGESGCGKSTLARVIVGLHGLSGGEVRFDGQPVQGHDRALSRRIQFIFQDPNASLDPRVTVGESIGEGLVIHGIGDAKARRAAVGRMLEVVGLPPEAADRFPHEFSGGQRQRIGIARALILEPELLICDEPTSALDVSVQAQVLNLLMRLKEELGLTMLFISHNLAVVEHIADDVMVMYLGRAVEIAPVATLFATPRHPYTRALLSATPVADPTRRGQRIRLEGDIPSPVAPPPGCAFHPRCPLATEVCRSTPPALREIGEAQVSCHHAEG